MKISRLAFAIAAAFLFASSPSFALQFPLSDSASRSAYFLGQRRDNSTGEFLARYSKHLPPPKTGPYVSDILFLTPFAQLVDYSRRQSIYSAQQAEAEGPKNFASVEIAVYIYFAQPSSLPLLVRPASTDVDQIDHLESWRNYTVHVFDGEELRGPTATFSQSQTRCTNRGGCIRVGTAIRLSVPADQFSSDSAKVEVTTPDGQVVTAEFNLASLR